MATLALSRDQIVKEALGLLREGGMEAVSLRRIAARLGVKAPSLYWHVESKEVLTALMSRAIFLACVDAVGPARDWREWLRGFGLSIWCAQRSVPDIRQLIGRAAPDEAERRALLARIIDRLAELGLPREVAEVAQRSVQALVTGWTTLPGGRGEADAAAEAMFHEALDALIKGWAARVGEGVG